MMNIHRSIRLFLVAAIVASAFEPVAQAQWTTSGNNIYNTNSGNVGIGSTAPLDKLSVFGRVSSFYDVSVYPAMRAFMTHEGNGGGLTLTSQGADNAQFGSGDIRFVTSTANSSGPNVDAATAERMRIRFDGNVGIGSINPPQTLSVVGTIGLSESGGACCRLLFTTGGSGTTVNHNDNSPIFFQTEGTTWLTIKNGTGNVGIGTANPSSKLDVAGDLTVSGNISAKYQDIAEWVPSRQDLTSGSVVVLTPGQGNSVVRSSTAYDTRVAGVVSENPGIVLGEAGEGKIRVATTGRVKVHVDASASPIEVGDLLVTSGKEGMAMRSEPVNISGIEFHRPGTLIGKALEPLGEGEGEILVLLSLQ